MRRLRECTVSGYSAVCALGAFAAPRLDSGPPGPAPGNPELDWRRSGLCRGEDGEVWGRVPGSLPGLPAELARFESRCARLLAHALQPLLLQVAHLLATFGRGRVGIVLGSSTGGIDATELALEQEHAAGALPSGYVFAEAHPYQALLDVARSLTGIEGPAYVISTACSSSAKALAAAHRLLASGVCDAVLCGGSDALTGITRGGFRSLGILSETRCRPFQAERTGLNLGEGAALLLLERRTSGRIVLLGAGESSDAYHPTAPHPDGLGARLALSRCLHVSGLSPEQVDFVHAHGTGTAQNDSVEATALAAELGRVPFASTKDRTGHLLGTAGALAAVFCIETLVRAKSPGPLDPRAPDPSLTIPPQLRETELPRSRARGAVTLLNTFAFGGNNVTVAFGQGTPGGSGFDASPEQGPLAILALSPFLSGDPVPPALLLGRRTRGRASLLDRLSAELVARVAADASLSETSLAHIPLFFGSAYGELATSLSLLEQVVLREPLSPAKFQASVHNTAVGLLGIATGNREASTAISAGPETFAMTLLEASTWLRCHGGRALVVVVDEEGPAHLLAEGAFPALGVALLLSAEPSPGARGYLSDFRLEGGLPTPPAVTAAPPSWAAPLSNQLAQGRPGRVVLGPRTSAALDLPRAER